MGRKTKVWTSESPSLTASCALSEIPNLLYSYWAYKNAWSMDGLPGLQRGGVAAKKYSVAPIKKMIGPLAPTRYQHGLGFTAQQILLVALVSFLIGIAVVSYAHVVAEKVAQLIKGSPLELNIRNMTDASSSDGLTGLWSTKSR